MFFFAVFTLISFTMLFFALADKIETFEKPGSKIGEKQLAVLESASNGEKALFYVDIAASYAYDTAVLETAKEGYVDQDLCGSYRGTAVVYGITDCFSYNEDLEVALERKLGEEFNSALFPYTETYEASFAFPPDTYFLNIQNEKIIGIPQESVEIPIFSTTSATLSQIQKEEFGNVLNTFSMFSQWPVALDEKIVNSCFGFRGGDGDRENKWFMLYTGSEYVKATTYHPGIDIRAPLGTPVLAIANGIVTQASPSSGIIVIDHGNGIYSRYLHLDTISVIQGQKVIQGQEIGTAGARSKSGQYAYGKNNAHLHFEILDSRIPENLVDERGNKAVLYSEYLNPLCYLNSDMGYTFKHGENTLGCNTDGGPYKFCDLYKENLGITQTYDKETKKTTYTADASGIALVQQIDTNYGTLIDSALQETTIRKALFIGLIAAESTGNPNAGSKTGCQGLLQFCEETAYDYGLCSDVHCNNWDNRKDPERAIPAGATYLNKLLKRYENYKDQEIFAVAAYNAGHGTINALIAASGKSDPSWEEVSTQLSDEIIAQYLGKYFPTKEGRIDKIEEIRKHVNHVRSYTTAYEQIEKENTNK